MEEGWNRQFLKKRTMEVDRKARDEKYRQVSRKDPKLPRN